MRGICKSAIQYYIGRIAEYISAISLSSDKHAKYVFFLHSLACSQMNCPNYLLKAKGAATWLLIIKTSLCTLSITTSG